MPILQVVSLWGLVEVLCSLFTRASCFSARLMLAQNSTLESLLKYSESHANTEYKSTTAVSFSCRGYSAASDSSRSHANAGELVQQSLSLCFFSGWTWSFITTCITNLFLVLGGSWKKKESCYITVRRWVFDCTVLPCTSWFYIWWNETKTMRGFEAITKIHVINYRSQHSETSP